MAWDFSTEPDFQETLDWASALVRDEVEPARPGVARAQQLQAADLRAPQDRRSAQQSVRDHGLWACHLGPELGGQGYGQVKLALLKYDNVRVPADSLLGPEGGAFTVAQVRLGGGRVHHAMRTVGVAQRALDMLCERALSRRTKNTLLAEKQKVQEYIADSYAQLRQFRLFVMNVAWQIDRYQDYKKVRKDIAAIKALTPTVLHDIVYRTIQIHGALGVSNELPLAHMWLQAPVMGIADGPTEVHKVTVAREVLKDYGPADGLWPSEHLPARLAGARAKLADVLELELGNL
jgi:acyl-CoA dehydrogenase